MSNKIILNIESANEKINSNIVYQSNDLKKIINNAYFSPNTAMSLNGEVIGSMIINDGLFIKLENIEKVKEVAGQEKHYIEFNYDFFDHKMILKTSLFNNLFLVEEVISATHKYKPENMIVDDYARLNIDNNNIVINISEISENYICFKVLKKDEDLILEYTGKKIKIEMNKLGFDFILVIKPELKEIIDNEMYYESELFFDTIENAEKFNSIYISKVKHQKVKKEKEIQINNIITQLLENKK